MQRIAVGTRDEHGVWHPDDPSRYRPIDVHGIWPWTVLDQTSTAWRDRKTWWTSRIISAAPQAIGPAMINTGRHGRRSGGISTFDPVLAELCYTWYTPSSSRVLDPFAGSPVRGVVATTIGHDYLGADINPAQTATNQEAYPDLANRWTTRDAITFLSEQPAGQANYILACPPYHNRERYTDLSGDLSAVPWDTYLDMVRQTMTGCWTALTQDTFMTWVVGDVRDYRGHLRRLPHLVAAAAHDAGFRLCNEQILLEPAGLRAKTTRPSWEACRTATRRHQTIYTWVKGSRQHATERITNADR